MKLTRREHEDIAKRIITFHISSANSILKTTVSHFLKQKIPRQTTYDILKKYNVHKTTTFLSKSGRPPKISDKEVQSLVKTVNNKTGISQRRLGRQFGVHQSTISRTLKKRTSVRIFTRRKAPKYRDENQKHRAQSNSWTLYQILKPDVQLILDDEKYFSLNGDISCNRKYYTTDRSTAPSEVKFKTKMKFEPKLLVWMAVSQKGISSIYVHRSTIPIKQETYLHDCIRKRLSIVITRMTMFYFGQILLHHITRNKFKNFSRQITSNLYNVSKILQTFSKHVLLKQSGRY